jgi:putative zincin peptidase
MALIVVDRYHPHLRRELQSAVDGGHIQKYDELALLEPEGLRPLALLSLVLLIIGIFFFVALDLTSYFWQAHVLFKGVTWQEVAIWLGINIIGYIIILPTHEAIHGLAILFWGGRPHFGAKLPLALFCGARQQVFRRNQYIVIAMAPLVVISVAGIALTLLAPDLATYALFAIAGNISGSAGDLVVVWRLCRLPRHILVEDTETGYCAWEVAR